MSVIFKSLPALDSKDQPAVKKVTNKKLGDPNNKDGTVWQIPAERISFPQIDLASGDFWQDYVNFCGGEELAKELINAKLEEDAVSSGLTYARTATQGTPDEITEAAIKRIREYTPVREKVMTAKEAKENLVNLSAEAANLSDEELASRVRAMFGKL